MVICGSCIHELSASKYMEKINNNKRRNEAEIGKVTAQLCLALLSKELKTNGHGRMVTTLNMLFYVVCRNCFKEKAQ